MRKKITNIFVALVVIIATCIITYNIVEIKKLKDPDSIEHYIAVYENEQSNYYLIALCNKLSLENDKRLLKYFETFMDMENFDEEVRNYEGGTITDGAIDFYHDNMLSYAFKICAERNNIDLFTELMLKYYPQIRDDDKLFYLAQSNDGSDEITAFFKTNSEKILESFEKLYAETDNPELRLQYLTVIADYYRDDEAKYEIYKEKYHDELAQLVEKCVPDSDYEEFGVLLGYYSLFREHMYTGKNTAALDSVYAEKWSKYNAEDSSN